MNPSASAVHLPVPSLGHLYRSIWRFAKGSRLTMLAGFLSPTSGGVGLPITVATQNRLFARERTV